MPRQTTGIISGFTSALESDKPDLRVQRLVKDPQLEELWRSGFGMYNRDRRQSARNLQAFARLFNQQYPGIMDRELGAVGNYFDGDIEQRLAGLRRGENELFQQALERGLGGVDQGLGASAVAGTYSPRSSYGQRIRDAARTDLMLQEALRQASAERSDFSNLERAKLGLIGSTIPIMRGSLIPSELKSANFGRLAGLRAQQLATDPGIYNIWRKRGSMEMATDILDSLAQGAYKGANAFSTFSGMGGGMGGGMMGGMGGGGDMGGTARANQGADILLSSGWGFGGGGGGAPAGTNYNPYTDTSDLGWGSPQPYRGSSGSAFNDWWNSPQGGF